MAEAGDHHAEDMAYEGAVSEEEEVEPPQLSPALAPEPDLDAVLELESDIDEGSADPENVSSDDSETSSDSDPEPAVEFSDSGEDNEKLYEELYEEERNLYEAIADEAPAVNQPAGIAVPEQHRGVIYNPRLHQPLYKDAGVTVIQAVFALVTSKIKNNMSDAGFDEMLKLNKRFAPQPNLYPSSFFVCKSILGVKPVKEVEWHTCGCQETAWDPKGPSTPEDACSKCHEPRYIFNMRGKLVPSQVCEIVCEMFTAS